MPFVRDKPKIEIRTEKPEDVPTVIENEPEPDENDPYLEIKQKIEKLCGTRAIVENELPYLTNDTANDTHATEIKDMDLFFEMFDRGSFNQKIYFCPTNDADIFNLNFIISASGRYQEFYFVVNSEDLE